MAVLIRKKKHTQKQYISKKKEEIFPNLITRNDIRMSMTMNKTYSVSVLNVEDIIFLIFNLKTVLHTAFDVTVGSTTKYP